MQNCLNPPSIASQQKILSTENSRNSTTANLAQRRDGHGHEHGHGQLESDSSFRLFTFMNVRNQDSRGLDKGVCNRRKSVKKIGSKGLKKDHSGLITMIEESRKKRENFYKLILDSQSLVTIDNDRKCKTPTGMRHTSNNVSVKCFNSKKFITPRASTNKQPPFGQKDQKPRKPTPLQTKNTNSEIRLSLKKQQPKPPTPKNDKNPSKADKFDKFDKLDKLDKLDKQEEAALLRKKRDLEKQLLEINQTILLGHQKKRNKVPKTRR